MTGVGAVLRARRVECGLSLDTVAERTRIPVAYLEALEDERVDELPAGPYREAYQRAYARVLELDLEPVPEPPPEPHHAVPLWGVRVVAVSLALGMMVGLAWQARAWWRAQEAEAARIAENPPPPALPDQHVVVKLQTISRLQIEVDGVVVHDRRFAEGAVLEMDAHDEVAVLVDPGGKVTVRHNDRYVEPQGSVRYPRRLVFLDDATRGD